MPRRAGIWARTGRAGFYATITGKQVFLAMDRQEAEQVFYRLKASGKPIERSRASVAALVDAYLEAASTEVKATTLANYHWYLSQWVAFVGTRPAAGLKPLDVTAWFRTKPGWNGSTKRLAAEMVRRWSRWTKAQGYLDTDVLSGIRVPRGVSRLPAPSEHIELFLAAITCPLLRDIAIVLLDTGARPGEIRTLTADQIDWEASTAVVVGKTGPRVISLTSRAVRILADRAALYPTGPLLRNRDRRAWTIENLCKRYKTICKRIGVHVIPYHARHDLWRRANKAGVSDITIAAQLGHKSLRMLSQHYAHPEPAMLKDAVERAQGNEPAA